MKIKSLLIGVLFTLSGWTTSYGQWIQSFTVIPSNPTTSDTVRILAYCMFPSTGCSDHVQYFSVAGNEIDAYAHHCVGLLTMICFHTDTFVIPPLPVPGNFLFRFTLDIGQGTVPCLPGMIPTQKDSITFQVSLPVSISEWIHGEAVKAVPNPSAGAFLLEGLAEHQYPVTATLSGVDGKLLRDMIIQKPKELLDLQSLTAGWYHLSMVAATGEKFVVPLIIASE